MHQQVSVTLLAGFRCKIAIWRLPQRFDFGRPIQPQKRRLNPRNAKQTDSLQINRIARCSKKIREGSSPCRTETSSHIPVVRSLPIDPLQPAHEITILTQHHRGFHPNANIHHTIVRQRQRRYSTKRCPAQDRHGSIHRWHRCETCRSRVCLALHVQAA